MSQEEFIPPEDPDPLPQIQHLSLVRPYEDGLSGAVSQRKASRISEAFSVLWAEYYPDYDLTTNNFRRRLSPDDDFIG